MKQGQSLCYFINFFYFIKFWSINCFISIVYPLILLDLFLLKYIYIYIYIYNMYISSVTFELMLIVILILLWFRNKKYILDDYSFEEDKSVSFVTFSFFFMRNCLWRKKYEHSDFQLYLRISSKIYWNRTVVYILANWYK